MAGKKLKNARQVALSVLSGFNPQKDDARELLHKLLNQTSQKRSATDIVFGVVRNSAVIDGLITEIADVHPERIPQQLLTILRIGVYELIFSPDTADYGIVNEAANQAKSIAAGKQAGFVNAILRQINRCIKNRTIPLSEADLQKTIPQRPGYGCEFKVNLFPNPKTAAAQYLSKAFSLPGWLVTSWLADFGTEYAQKACFASNRRPSISVRPNRLKITPQKLYEKFLAENIDCQILPAEAMIKLKAAGAVHRLPGFSQGLFSIQDITASQAAKSLAPQPGWTVADLCAGPGGKTTQMAELMADKGKIFAADVDSKRLAKVAENCQRLGITIVTTIKYEDLLQTAGQIGPFDAVLLDVPCSNTGVLAKRCEARHRIKPKTIKDLTKIQAHLLKTATEMLGKGGKICYSTCSIQKQENEQVVKNFSAKKTNLNLEFEKLTLPSADWPDCDGGFSAIIVKK